MVSYHPVKPAMFVPLAVGSEGASCYYVVAAHCRYNAHSNDFDGNNL